MRPPARGAASRSRLPFGLALVLAVTDPAAADGPAGGPRFVEVQEEVGLDFAHRHGGTGERYMAETMGAGGAFLDYDGDGWMDLYLVQSGTLDPGAPPSPGSALFRNQGDGTFRRAAAGDLGPAPGYGMGVCAADYDGDGWTDLYAANFGADLLLRNEGGRFRDVTAESRLAVTTWSASCTWLDIDRDGCLDLFVVGYVDFSLDHHIRCGPPAGESVYCHPDIYGGVSDRLWRNRCDGTFEDVSVAAGVLDDDPAEGKGLGVVASDLDGDGFPDLYVANDSTRNFLYRNRGDGTFEDVGVLSGAAFNARGVTEAGMGVASGDVDGDGLTDLFVTHLDFETNTLYRNDDDGFFTDVTETAGLAAPSLTRVGFGTELFDADHDGDLDLFVANGHILDNIAARNPTLSYAQPDQLFENRGSSFVDASRRAGAYFARPTVSRGAAAGDYDGDGALDLLVTASDGPPALLRNVGATGSWLMLRLLALPGGGPAVGARADLLAGGRRMTREVQAGSSYLSQRDARLHFGLGGGRVEGLEVRWPSGALTRLDAGSLGADRVVTLVQPVRP